MTYAQTAVKVEDIRLPGLDGMLPGAKVKGREKANLEILMAKIDDQLSCYTYLLQDQAGYYSLSSGHLSRKFELMGSMYKHFKEELKNVDYTEEDIKSFIFANINRKLTEDEAKVLGLYTGCLLSILTDKNKAQNKPTKLYIDGGGARFDYLFHSARHVDELIVDNFEGISPCNGVGEDGYANLVAITNCKGDNIGIELGANGKLGLVILVNNEDDEGSITAASKKGNADMYLIYNNESAYSTASNISDDGSIYLLFFPQSENGDVIAHSENYGDGLDLLLNEFGRNRSSKKKIETLKGKNHFWVYNDNASVVRKTVVCQTESKKSASKNIAVTKGSDVKEQFEELKQRYRLMEMKAKADSIESGNHRNNVRLIQEIHSIYQEVKPLLPGLKAK